MLTAASGVLHFADVSGTALKLGFEFTASWKVHKLLTRPMITHPCLYVPKKKSDGVRHAAFTGKHNIILQLYLPTVIKSTKVCR